MKILSNENLTLKRLCVIINYKVEKVKTKLKPYVNENLTRIKIYGIIDLKKEIIFVM